MRRKPPCFGLHTGGLAGTFDFLLEVSECGAGCNPGPQRARHAPALEGAGAHHFEREGCSVDLRETLDKVVGGMGRDFSDKAQRQVQLPIVLPAGAVDPVHFGEQCGAKGRGWAQADEQAMVHRGPVSGPRAAPDCGP
jgi:hypothetical protein